MSAATWYDHAPAPPRPTTDEILDTVRAIARKLEIESTGDVADDLERILEEIDRWKCHRTRRRGRDRAERVRRGRKAWPPELRATFRDRFREALQLRGLADDLHPLADELEVGWDHVYRMRAGRVAPSPPQLVVIADTLRVSIDWMLGRRKERGR